MFIKVLEEGKFVIDWKKLDAFIESLTSEEADELIVGALIDSDLEHMIIDREKDTAMSTFPTGDEACKQTIEVIEKANTSLTTHYIKMLEGQITHAIKNGCFKTRLYYEEGDSLVADFTINEKILNNIQVHFENLGCVWETGRDLTYEFRNKVLILSWTKKNGGTKLW